MPSTMLYPKHDPQRGNTNSYENINIVSWYINFLRE